jgi:hypothetical protein
MAKGSGNTSMTGRRGQMQQAATAEVRLDKHKAASFGPAGPSILPFWLSTKPAAIEFRCCGTPQGRKIATNNFGIREMSDEIARREQRRSAVPL